MISWRDEVVEELETSMGRFTLAADPDELLLEERMLQAIEELGFHLITFDDHVAFRFAFESRYRSLPERGEDTFPRILIRASAPDPSGLPFDLLEGGRRVSFSLGRLFPELSYPVVASLDLVDLDALFAAPGGALHRSGSWATERPGTMSSATYSASLRRRSTASKIFCVFS